MSAPPDVAPSGTPRGEEPQDESPRAPAAPADRASEAPAETPAATPAGAPAELRAAAPAEARTDPSAETLAGAPAEPPAETPVPPPAEPPGGPPAGPAAAAPVEAAAGTPGDQAGEAPTKSTAAPAAEAAGAPPGEPSPAPPITPEAVRIAEALLFASDRPVQPARLQQVLPEGQPAEAVLAALRQVLDGRGVVLVEAAGGWALRTAPDLAPLLTRVVEVPRRLPRVAMETLAVIAWHQPVTRGEIEEIRGAGVSQATLEALLEHGLVAPKGHKEVPGRPTLWGTTTKFLEQFGLRSLKDLPRREELVSAEAAAPLLSAMPQTPEEAPAREEEAAPAPPGPDDATSPRQAGDAQGEPAAQSSLRAD